MVQKVNDFNVIVVNSEFESLILENSLIKQHQPHYNILPGDDKGYPFIRLDKKRRIRDLLSSAALKKDGASYFGPFGGRSVTRDIINAASKAVDCQPAQSIFRAILGSDRPAPQLPHGQLPRLVGESFRRSEYRLAVEQVCLILGGKTGELIEELTAKMLEASEQLRFEAAAELRDRIKAIKSVSNKQKVIATAFSDTDAIGFARGAKAALLCCI